jgi:hypothetical protein
MENGYHGDPLVRYSGHVLPQKVRSEYSTSHPGDFLLPKSSESEKLLHDRQNFGNPAFGSRELAPGRPTRNWFRVLRGGIEEIDRESCLEAECHSSYRTAPGFEGASRLSNQSLQRR